MVFDDRTYIQILGFEVSLSLYTRFKPKVDYESDDLNSKILIKIINSKTVSRKTFVRDTTSYDSQSLTMESYIRMKNAISWIVS